MRKEKYYIKALASGCRRKLVNGCLVWDYRDYYTNNLMDIFEFLNGSFCCWSGFYIFKMPNKFKAIGYFSRSNSKISALIDENFELLQLPGKGKF